MDALYYIVISLFVVVCILLVAIILLQSSQTGGMGAALSGNALNSAFGGQGADKLLVRITAMLAALFMFLAVLLNMMSTPGSNDTRSIEDKSILDRNKLDSVIEVPVESIKNEEAVQDTL
mgnify:CR=1 FL=1